MNVRSDLAMAYHIGYEDALAKRMPNATKAGVLNSYIRTDSERTETCHVASSIIDTYEYNRWEYELSCGHTIIWEDSEPPKYCPECGRRIVEPMTNDVDAEVEQ